MRARTLLLSVLFCCAAAHDAAGLEARMPRHPAPSPDGNLIAFSWQGDIWVVSSRGGRARRLTAHPAADRHPVWSRDGAWIAFASDRHGNMDVFVMPADAAAPPRRLTHASADDIPADFHPDGGRVLFTSRRDESVRNSPAFYLVPLEGGTPALAQSALGLTGAYPPDGKSLVFVRGKTPWWRSGYSGSGSREIWQRTEDGSYERLTDLDGDVDCPSWLPDGRLLVLAALGGRKNLHLLGRDGDISPGLTDHEGSDVRYPRASADGTLAAYEFEDAVWTLALPAGRPRKLEIEVASDAVRSRVERHADRDGARGLRISPDGKLAAFVVHGEVFVSGIASKEDQEVAAPPTVRITATPHREKDLSWSPDGKSLLFASDREGSFDLWLARPADEEAGWTGSYGFDLTRLTDSPAEEHGAGFSPDGERIAYLRGKGDLVVTDTRGRKERVLFEYWDTPQGCDWSPDGKWIACSRHDMDYNSDIWILPAEGGEAYNVSRHPDEDTFPRWSPDGKRLLWLSKRHARSVDVWGVWLALADHERTPEGWLAHWKAAGKKDDKKGKGKKKGGEEGEEEEEEKELPEVSIDFEDLWRRGRPITSLRGDEGWAFASQDGRRVFFTGEVKGKRDLFSVRWDGEDLQQITQGGKKPRALQLTRDGKTIFYLAGKGKIERVSAEGKAGDPVPFTARYEIDTAAEREAVFDEAWRAVGEWFYDPAFHGTDWKAQREKYRPCALAASHPDDFQDVVNLMLGELNASHVKYGNPRGEGGEATGWTGALFDPEAGGKGLRVREVLPDSPAARRDVDLRAGERILAVDGVPVDRNTNVYALFAGTVGVKVPLRIAGKGGRVRTAAVEPVDLWPVRQLRHRKWEKDRRGMVERLSGGRLGYLHVQGMSIPSFEEFERNLYAAGHGREGLVIDVRNNGGGWTTDYLLAVLEVRRHARTVPRGGDPSIRAYPQGRLPLAAWTRPALALCNEASFSNAEIFSHAFKTLGRGLLAGWPTYGGVISTGGTDLVNGGWVRLPLRGWWVGETGLNMENNGAVPDLLVAQPPAEDTSSTTDTQLEIAVRVFLERIEEDPRYGTW